MSKANLRTLFRALVCQCEFFTAEKVLRCIWTLQAVKCRWLGNFLGVFFGFFLWFSWCFAAALILQILAFASCWFDDKRRSAAVEARRRGGFFIKSDLAKHPVKSSAAWLQKPNLIFASQIRFLQNVKTEFENAFSGVKLAANRRSDAYSAQPC